MAIQSQIFSYGSLAYQSNTSGYVLELTVQEEAVSAADNTSSVSYTLKLLSGSNNRFNAYHIGAQVWLNGTLVGWRDKSTSEQVTLDYNSSAQLLSGTATVVHNADGSCTMPVAFSIEMDSGSYTPGNISASGDTMTLSQIPRESTLGATDAKIGSISMIAVTRHAEVYTHSIAYTFGGLSGYITAAGGVSDTEVKTSTTSIAFTVPDSFYTQIPAADHGLCTLTLRTYAGTTAVGAPSSCSFTVWANKEKCVPEIAWNVTDINAKTKALTGDEHKLIRYCSTAHCEIQVTAKNSASPAKAQIGGVDVSMTAGGYGTRTIYEAETGSFSFYGEDGRGYGNSVSVTAETVPYIKLTRRITVKRANASTGEAKLIITGNYYNSSFGAASNTLHVRYKPSGAQVYSEEFNITYGDGTYSATVSLGQLDYQEEYSYDVQVYDALMKLEDTITVGKGVPVFHWGAKDFAFCVPVKMNQKPIRQAYSVNGLVCGGVAFDDNVTTTIPIKDRSLMLFGLAGNTGEYALYLIMLQSTTVLSQCVRLSGTLDVSFSLNTQGQLTVVSPTKWSYGWYIHNSTYADLISQ